MYLSGLFGVRYCILTCFDFIIYTFLHSGVVNLKNLFLRLSVLQSISGIFSRFFLLYCTWIFPFPHNISSFFCFEPYYYAVSRKIFFRISFGFSRYYLMLLYKTFRNLYKTKYFLYKNRREFRHVFLAFSGSFYADCGFLGGVPCLFEWKSPVFSFIYPFF